MPVGHVKTITEVTGSLLASGGAIEAAWKGQTTDVRFNTADVGSVDPIGPAGWLARTLKITAQPAQTCTVLVERGYVDGMREKPYLIWIGPAGHDLLPLPDYQPWIWTPVGSITFSAGVQASQTFTIAPAQWIRVRLLNGATAQGAVTISEEFLDA